MLVTTRRRCILLAVMTASLRIAHCSDIHLDGDHYSRGENRPAGDHYREWFVRTLRAARADKPDVLLLAGDLFDSNLASSETIQWAMDRLSEQPFPIVMIPGNHDCLADNAIYHRFDFNRLPNVDRLSLENGSIARIPELDVAVWGKGMIDHAPTFSPLSGRPERPEGCRWYLGMGHGIHVPHGEPSHRSSPIHMHEIEASPFDYLALGHHHAAMELTTDATAAAYCGSPTDDIGRGHTYVIVDLAEGTRPELQVKLVGP